MINLPADLIDVWQHAVTHTRLKQESISLIATENQLSPLARAALSSDLAQRYLLLDNTIWEYPQTTHLLAIAEACERVFRLLYAVPFVNLRPISGLNCMTVVLSAFGRPNTTLYTMDPCCGGHGATRVVAERLGMTVRTLPYDASRLEFDLDAIKMAFAATPPDLIYVDLSTILFPPSLSGLASITPAGATIYCDCSHILGLMLDPNYFNPFREGLGVCGGSTHKTFPGPQRGVVMMQHEDLSQRLEQTTDMLISNHHLGSLLALCVTAIEMATFGRELSLAMRRNAVALGEQLLAEGLPVETRDGVVTATHQVWIRASVLDMDPHRATDLLVRHNIAVNCTRIPREPHCGKGLRFGTSEVTRLGFTADDMRTVARLIADALLARRTADTILRDVRDLRLAHPSPRYCFSGTEELVDALHAASDGSVDDTAGAKGR